jgi:hypothetical protein
VAAQIALPVTVNASVSWIEVCLNWRVSPRTNVVFICDVKFWITMPNPIHTCVMSDVQFCSWVAWPSAQRPVRTCIPVKRLRPWESKMLNFLKPEEWNDEQH